MTSENDADDSNDSAVRDLEELRSAVLEDWVVITSMTAGALAEFQSTLSWRITRPLRLFRRYQIAVERHGFREATELGAVAVAERLRRR
jgi:hypothetical protein